MHPSTTRLIGFALLLAGIAVGQAEAAAPVLTGRTDCPWGAPDCNRCVDNVVDAMNRLGGHGDTLGFRLNDASDVSLFHHWQGIQRLGALGGRYLAVSRSVEDENALFVVVEMGSRDADGKRFRSNRLVPNQETDDTPPFLEDGVIVQVPRLPEFHHAGGMQALGNFLAVGVERSDVRDPVTHEIVEPGASLALFYDLSDPRSPRKLDTEIDHTDLANAAGALIMGRLLDGRILVGIGRGDSAVIDFYVSGGTELEGAVFAHFDTWSKGELRTDIGDDDFGDYQSVNLVTQCDGTLFLVGTHQNGFSGQDFADTFRLENGTGNDVVITKVASRHLVCDDIGEQQCNLDAAGGVYLDPEGHILVYGTEHDNDGPGGSVKFREFRPVPHSGCGNIRDAWVEFFVNHSFDGRSLMIDYVDRNRRNYRNYDEAEEFGDAPSSAYFCLPVGATYRVWQNAGCDGDHRDLVGTGEFERVDDFHDLSFDDEVSCSEWIGGPFADAGPDQMVECEGARTTALVNRSGSSDANGAELTFHWTSTEASFESSSAPVTLAHFLPGSATIALTVGNGIDVNTDTALLRTQDNLPPAITCPAPVSVECVAPGGTPASDAGGQAFLGGATAQDLCDTSLAITNDAPGFLPLGATPVGFTATDDAHLRDSCGSTLTVIDTTDRPSIWRSRSPPILPVPNHNLVPITVSHLASIEACQPHVRIECSVASNEAPDAQSGDGHTLPDIIFDGAPIAGTSSGFRPVTTSNGAGSFALALRAERKATGSGRVYTVTCRATDGSGNTGAGRSATVVVPRTLGGPKGSQAASTGAQQSASKRREGSTSTKAKGRPTASSRARPRSK
jgi:hypothetical protein